MSEQLLLPLKCKTVFAELFLQRLCFYPKYEPPGCVVLELKSEGRRNRCLQLIN